MDTRKSIKVSGGVKAKLQEVRRMIPFKTESETIAYLLMVNTWAMTHMPTNVYREAQQKARELDQQQTLF